MNEMIILYLADFPTRNADDLVVAAYVLYFGIIFIKHYFFCLYVFEMMMHTL